MHVVVAVAFGFGFVLVCKLAGGIVKNSVYEETENYLAIAFLVIWAIDDLARVHLLVDDVF